MNKNVTKLVGALSIAALASMGCASKEEKPAEGAQPAAGGASSCSASGKPAEGDGKGGAASCNAATSTEKKQ
jgi:hypothetical protein